MARNVWYTKEGKKLRTTKDADFAVLVGSHTQYEEVKDYLKRYKNFQDSKGNAFVLLAPGDIQVDILPFGQVAIDEGVKVAGDGLSAIKVNGIMEVYQQGTEPVEVATGHRFKIATLPAIVLLKLIAYDDRPVCFLWLAGPRPFVPQLYHVFLSPAAESFRCCIGPRGVWSLELEHPCPCLPKHRVQFW